MKVTKYRCSACELGPCCAAPENFENTPCTGTGDFCWRPFIAKKSRQTLLQDVAEAADVVSRALGLDSKYGVIIRNEILVTLRESLDAARGLYPGEPE